MLQLKINLMLEESFHSSKKVNSWPQQPSFLARISEVFVVGKDYAILWKASKEYSPLYCCREDLNQQWALPYTGEWPTIASKPKTFWRKSALFGGHAHCTKATCINEASPLLHNLWETDRSSWPHSYRLYPSLLASPSLEISQALIDTDNVSSKYTNIHFGTQEPWKCQAKWYHQKKSIISYRKCPHKRNWWSILKTIQKRILGDSRIHSTDRDMQYRKHR